MSKNKNTYTETIEFILRDAETASDALQHTYSLLEDVGEELTPASRAGLEKAVAYLESAMLEFEETPWCPPRRVKVTLVPK